MDDSKLGDTIELFGGRQAPRAMAALILSSGWADHYSAAAMYLRLNGICRHPRSPRSNVSQLAIHHSTLAAWVRVAVSFRDE